MADDLSLYWSLFQGEFPGESIEDATTMGHWAKVWFLMGMCAP